jgi:hypothetical protein
LGGRKVAKKWPFEAKKPQNNNSRLLFPNQASDRGFSSCFAPVALLLDPLARLTVHDFGNFGIFWQLFALLKRLKSCQKVAKLPLSATLVTLQTALELSCVAGVRAES